MQKRNTLLLLLMFVVLATSAQVTFILNSVPENTPPDKPLFIAGNLNGWNPGDSTMLLWPNNDNLFEITLGAQPEGTSVEFKFTRGSWETVEKGLDGEEIDNRTFTYGNSDTVHTEVYNWISSIPEKRGIESLSIYPNPVDKLLMFPKELVYGSNDSLLIFDATGKSLLEINNFKGQPVSVCGLMPGIYFFRLTTKNIEFSGQFIKN